jgi:hypothetical protein
MPILYVYEIESREVLAEITAKTTEECDDIFFRDWDGREDVGTTYNPAFGANDGLVK